MPGIRTRGMAKGDENTTQLETINTILETISNQINTLITATGDINLQQYMGVNCGPANPIDTQTIVAGAPIDPRDIRALTTADEITVTPDVGSLWDISDRWARLLGQVDLARVLGASLTAANPVITGVFDALGNRMPAMDAVGRRGYIQLTDGTNPVDNASLTAAGATTEHLRVATIHDAKTYQVIKGQVNATTPLGIGVVGKIPKIHCYSLQAEGGNPVRVRFIDTSTGAPVSQDWIFQSREGVSKGFAPAPAFLFEGTIAGNDISIYLDQAEFVNFELTYSVDDAT